MQIHLAYPRPYVYMQTAHKKLRSLLAVCVLIACQHRGSAFKFMVTTTVWRIACHFRKVSAYLFPTWPQKMALKFLQLPAQLRCARASKSWASVTFGNKRDFKKFTRLLHAPLTTSSYHSLLCLFRPYEHVCTSSQLIVRFRVVLTRAYVCACIVCVCCVRTNIDDDTA